MKQTGACQISNINNTLLRKLNIKLIQVILYTLLPSFKGYFFLSGCFLLEMSLWLCTLHVDVLQSNYIFRRFFCIEKKLHGHDNNDLSECEMYNLDKAYLQCYVTTWIFLWCMCISLESSPNPQSMQITLCKHRARKSKESQLCLYTLVRYMYSHPNTSSTAVTDNLLFTLAS